VQVSLIFDVDVCHQRFWLTMNSNVVEVALPEDRAWIVYHDPIKGLANRAQHGGNGSSDSTETPRSI